MQSEAYHTTSHCFLIHPFFTPISNISDCPATSLNNNFVSIILFDMEQFCFVKPVQQQRFIE